MTLALAPKLVTAGMVDLAVATGSAQLAARSAYGFPIPLGTRPDAGGLVSQAVDDFHKLRDSSHVAALPPFTPGPMRRLFDWRITVAEAAAQQMLRGGLEAAKAIAIVARVTPILEGLRRLALVREMLKEFRMPEDSALPWRVTKERFENTRCATGLQDSPWYRGGIVEIVAPEQFAALRERYCSYWRSGENALPRLSLSLQNYFCGAHDIELTEDEQRTVRCLSNQYLDVVLSPYMGVSALGHLPRYYGALPAPSPTVRIDFWKRFDSHYSDYSSTEPRRSTISDHQAVRWSRRLVIAIERAKNWDQLIRALHWTWAHLAKTPRDELIAQVSYIRAAVHQESPSRTWTLQLLRLVTPDFGIRRRVASFPPFADHDIQPWELAREDDHAAYPDIVAEAMRIWEGKPVEPTPPPAPIVEARPPEPPATPVEDRAPARRQLLSVLQQRLAARSAPDAEGAEAAPPEPPTPPVATDVPTFHRDAPTEHTPPPLTPTDLIGQVVLGRYRIIEFHRQGSQGFVYRGVGTELEGQPVICKVFPLGNGADAETARELSDEAAILCNLNSPHIVTPLGFGPLPKTIGRGFVLVMKEAPGDTLRGLLKKESGRIAPFRVYRLIEQLLEALNEAHGNGIRHHDLKPENIIVQEIRGIGDRVVVIDFGISRLAENEVTLAKDKRVVGTSAYMAPERAKGHPGDARSDLYSVGVIMYELLTGRRPFIHEDPAEIRWAHIHTSVPPIAWRPFEPACSHLKALLYQTLEKDPDKRPQTTLEFLRRLKAAESLDRAAAEDTGTGAMDPLGEAEEASRAETASPNTTAQWILSSGDVKTDPHKLPLTQAAEHFIREHRLDPATCHHDLRVALRFPPQETIFDLPDIFQVRAGQIERDLVPRIPAALGIDKDKKDKTRMKNFVFGRYQALTAEERERWWQLDGHPHEAGRGAGFPPSLLRILGDELHAPLMARVYSNGVSPQDWHRFQVDLWHASQRARDIERHLRTRPWLFPGDDVPTFRARTEQQVEAIYEAIPGASKNLFWQLDGGHAGFAQEDSLPDTFLVWTYRLWQQILRERVRVDGVMGSAVDHDGTSLLQRIQFQLGTIGTGLKGLQTRLAASKDPALRRRLIETQLREFYALPELPGGEQAFSLLIREVERKMHARDGSPTAEMLALPGSATRTEIAAAIQKMQSSDAVADQLGAILPHLREPPAEADIDYLKLLQAMHP